MGANNEKKENSARLQNLVDQSIDVLRLALNDKSISMLERAEIALKILENNGNDFLISEFLQGKDVWEKLPQKWKSWISHNKKRGCSNQALLKKMLEGGVTSDLASLALEEYDNNASIRSHSSLSNTENQTEIQRLRKLESVISNQRYFRTLSQKKRSIERREYITKTEFLDGYYSTNTPVIITNMMQDWPALTKWNPAFLKSEYGRAEVEVQLNRSSDPNYEINAKKFKTKMRLSDYVDRILSSGETNDFYMVANNHNIQNKELKPLLKDVEFSDLLRVKDSHNIYFWFGPAGTITPLHHDSINIMMAHVYGRKRWRLINPLDTPLLYNHIGVFSQVDLEDPDYTTYPLFREVEVIEETLNPGEILFVPVGWWHQVKALDISISISFSNFAFPNKKVKYKNPSNLYMVD